MATIGVAVRWTRGPADQPRPTTVGAQPGADGRPGLADRPGRVGREAGPDPADRAYCYRVRSVAWSDRLLAGVVVVATVVEVAMRDDLHRPVVSLLFGLVLAAALLVRRRWPFRAAAAGFGPGIVLAFAPAGLDTATDLVVATAALILGYAVMRWGDRRAMRGGAVLMLTAWAVAVVADPTDLVTAAGGLAVLALTAALGVASRLRAQLAVQRLERARSSEREVLARELHDTVAHHVTAITVTAQAGRVMAGRGDLTGAGEALAVIEQESIRSMTEMRRLVGALRGDAAPPVAGSTDLERLRDTGPLPVVVEHHGDVDSVSPLVASALFRIAQESVTNAQRHARHATRIRVELTAGPEVVRLRVSDDGEHPAFARRPVGYGLVGMTERAALLDGSLSAGPADRRGWTVDAVIPRGGGIR